MKLYHFTCMEHLEEILIDKHLKTTESNVSMRRPLAGPDVVWLLDSPSPEGQKWGDGGKPLPLWPIGKKTADKYRIRVTVDVEGAVRWSQFAVKHGVKKRWCRILKKTGGDSRKWYVIERPIAQDEWLVVEDMQTGEVVWDRCGGRRQTEQALLPLAAQGVLSETVTGFVGGLVALRAQGRRSLRAV